jgi:hypothetical protein
MLACKPNFPIMGGSRHKKIYTHPERDNVPLFPGVKERDLIK